jgi:benzoyl-CoA reductase/2-hydroxyglutaryl-CoA dehydratase subunit BcrC/BadD/HgdB
MEGVIAYFDSSHDMPEEILMAAGKIPYKILGDVHTPNDPADKYLFETFCPAARSFLTEALCSPNKWEGIVAAHGCDATHRQFDV